MMMWAHPFLSLCLVFVLGTAPASVFGLNVQFYEGKNNTGSYHEVDSFEGRCHNVDSRFTPVHGSVQTDTCLMVYIEPNCEDFSAKVLPGSRNVDFDLFLLPYEYIHDPSYKPYILPSYFGIKSFSPCTRNVGGPELFVDVYYDQEPKYAFENLCGCRNLPQKFYYKDGKGSVTADNHGNSFKVYTEQDCEGLSQVVPAGNNRYARDLTNFKLDQATPEYHPIKSIGHVRGSHTYNNDCLKLTSTVYKFEFLDSPTKDDAVNQQNVELTQKTIFRNNGTAKLTQEYKVATKITESAEVQVASALSNIHKGVVEYKVTFEAGAGVPMLAETKVTNEMRAAYEYQHTSTDTDTKRNVTVTSREISIRQQIDVPACSEYTVSAYVVMEKDKPFPYKVHSKITGELGGERMTAKEIRDHVDGTLAIVGDFDEHTVLVTAEAVMTTSFGIKSMIDGEGKKIPGCETK